MRPTVLQVWIGAALMSYGVLALGASLSNASPDRYAKDDAWLCRPGRHDTCNSESSVTLLGADGSPQDRLFVADSKAPIDCFYVYPTISENPHGNSELTKGPGEERAVAQQFAPFASVCRPYAPLYRQVTLAGLMSRYSAKPMAIDQDMAYGDVLDAWHHYLKYDNHGRGLVLIGHSQGARWLVRLMQSELDVISQKPMLVSAVLLGWNIEVPIGQVVGGTFRRSDRLRHLFRDLSRRGSSPRWGRPAFWLRHNPRHGSAVLRSSGTQRQSTPAHPSSRHQSSRTALQFGHLEASAGQCTHTVCRARWTV
jgi:hypothetical protein